MSWRSSSLGWTWEIVFVDDGSEDETRAIIRDICAADARCRSIFHDRNRGPWRRVQDRVCRSSEGRVTGFLDIDLEVHARYIPGLVNEIVRHGADVVTGQRHFLLRQTRGLHRMALVLGLPAAVRRLAVAGPRGQRDRLQVLQTREDVGRGAGQRERRLVLGHRGDGARAPRRTCASRAARPVPAARRQDATVRPLARFVGATCGRCMPFAG